MRRIPGAVRRGTDPDPGVVRALQVAAGYAWRLIVVLAAVYLAFVALARVQLAVVAVFGALVLTALLRPVVDQAARLLPRPLAVAVSMLAGFAAVGGLFTFVAVAVAGQTGALVRSFQSGVSALTRWLRTSPLHIRPEDISGAAEQARGWLTEHRTQLAGQALGGAGTAAEFLTGAAVALFCAVFFLASGERMWSWFLSQLSSRSRPRFD